MFTKGTYRHDCTTDIDMEVYTAYPYHNGYLVKATLFNRYNGDVYVTKQFYVKQEHLPLWKRVNHA
jgi:hypothetical protein